MRDGHGRWLPSRWEELMSLTIKAIDSISEPDREPPNWTFGGGTSLAIDLDHRVSYDIDAFMESAKAVHDLVPIRNLVTREICTNTETGSLDFRFPGNYLKLMVSGLGEIDFLGAYPLLDKPTTDFDFHGRTITRELPREVLAKKLYYRGTHFKARDIFDLAALYRIVPEELDHVRHSPFFTDDVYERVRLRITSRLPAFAEEVAEEVNPTETGLELLPDACELALEAIDYMQSRPIPAY